MEGLALLLGRSAWLQDQAEKCSECCQILREVPLHQTRQVHKVFKLLLSFLYTIIDSSNNINYLCVAISQSHINQVFSARVIELLIRIGVVQLNLLNTQVPSLFCVREMHLENGPPLPLGEQLRRLSQLQSEQTLIMNKYDWLIDRIVPLQFFLLFLGYAICYCLWIAATSFRFFLRIWLYREEDLVDNSHK